MSARDEVTDPLDPRLGRGADDTPVPQNEAYLVLSAEERANGFVQPVRRAYMHIECPVDVPNHGKRDALGRLFGPLTTMSQAIAETYARDPHFYGATYCAGCKRHRPVEEFVWDQDGTRVGS